MVGEEKRRREEEEKRRREKEEESRFGTSPLFGNCFDYLYGNTINLFLSKLG